MKNSFSIHRIYMLSRIHLTGKLPVFTAMYALLIFIMVYISNFGEFSISFYKLLFPFVYYLMGSVYTASFWGSWTNKGKATAYLSIPASLTEKFAVSVIFTWLIYTIVFTVLYFITAFIAGNVFQSSFSITDLIYSKSDYSIFVSFSYKICLINYLILHSLFLFGSLFFNKKQFSFTAITVFLLIMIYFAGNSYLFEKATGWLIWGTDSMLLIGGQLKPQNRGFTQITMNETISMLSYFIWILIPLLVYAATYFKLKEKEI